MLVEKIVCFAVLAAAVLVFIYSLGLVTDLHYNNFAYYAEKVGKPKFAYFKDEIGGFAVHIVQK